VLHEPSFIEELDQTPTNATAVSIRSYVDDFMQRQGKLLNAAMRSQEATNEKTYENGMRTILDYQLRRRRITDTILEEHEESRDSQTSIAHMFSIKVKLV